MILWLIVVTTVAMTNDIAGYFRVETDSSKNCRVLTALCSSYQKPLFCVTAPRFLFFFFASGLFFGLCSSLFYYQCCEILWELATSSCMTHKLQKTVHYLFCSSFTRTSSRCVKSIKSIIDNNWYQYWYQLINWYWKSMTNRWRSFLWYTCMIDWLSFSPL